MDTDTAIVVTTHATPAACETDTDGQVIGLWLHGRSAHTQRAYRADVERFRGSVGKPLAAVTLADLQAFADKLAQAASATQGRMLSSVKSLLAFAHKLGYLPFDVGRALKLPKRKDTLAERILSEGQVQRLLAVGDDNPRNAVMLKLLYAAGVRVSELCGLRWRDCQERGDAGQLTVYGKGGKTRVVLLPATVWGELVALRDEAGPNAPVFLSRKGGALDPSQVTRIVHAAAKRAKLKAPVSPHWLRHAHASHAIDRGAPVSLVQATLGHSDLSTTGRYLHARPNDSSGKYLAL